MKAEFILPLIGLAGTLADYVTTQIGLRTLGIAELNPLVNPVLEGAFAVGGPILIMQLGKRLAIDKNLTITLSAIPVAVPLTVAIRNLVIIGTVNARRYPIAEFPLIM